MTEQEAYEILHMSWVSGVWPSTSGVIDAETDRALGIVLDTLDRYRKALEHIASGTERGGMQIAIAQQALTGDDYDGEALVKFLEKKETK